VQHERDGDLLKAQGFTNITSLSLEKTVEFEGIILNKTGGSHGTTEMYAVPQLAEILDEAMGVIFQAKGHTTVYLVGDTIWTAEVNKAINRYKPDVMIMNTGGCCSCSPNATEYKTYHGAHGCGKPYVCVP